MGQSLFSETARMFLSGYIERFFSGMSQELNQNDNHN